MLKSMVTGGLIAGCAAGLLAALLHFWFLEGLILEGERYESGELTHFADVGSGDHDHAAAPAAQMAQPPADAGATEAEGHDHHHAAADGEDSGLTRHGLTVLFYMLTYTGFALVMAAAMAVARSRGHVPDLARGILWGIAGFVAVQMAPALGLAPELPGTPAANIDDRQIWWVATVLATAIALALAAFGPRPWAPAAAVVLAALPHVIGAPQLDGYAGIAPPELAGEFAARSLGIGLIAWSLLGGLLARHAGADQG